MDFGSGVGLAKLDFLNDSGFRGRPVHVAKKKDRSAVSALRPPRNGKSEKQPDTCSSVRNTSDGDITVVRDSSTIDVSISRGAWSEASNWACCSCRHDNSTGKQCTRCYHYQAECCKSSLRIIIAPSTLRGTERRYNDTVDGKESVEHLRRRFEARPELEPDYTTRNTITTTRGRRPSFSRYYSVSDGTSHPRRHRNKSTERSLTYL
ncbi:hypothetical protein F5Y18DRAFT_407079 [Xylariaceae sp. FL1019]|nr:hypothetical protein F5Y18DRAFT_407079 [Xylariaceae sp. FL1019]